MLSLIICVCEAFGYVYSGMYGDIATIGAGNAILIILQLTFAGIVVIMLDDMMQKGFGLGSGISLFIATNICENILWRALSPITIRTDSGTEFEGALISLIHQLITKPNKLNALHQAFYRTSSPNFNNLLATILVFLIVIYFQVKKLQAIFAYLILLKIRDSKLSSVLSAARSEATREISRLNCSTLLTSQSFCRLLLCQISTSSLRSSTRDSKETSSLDSLDNGKKPKSEDRACQLQD